MADSIGDMKLRAPHIIGIVLLFLGMAIYIGEHGGKDIHESSQQTPPAKPAIADENPRPQRPTYLTVVDASVVLAAYESNEIGADQTYKNRIIAVQGVVAGVGRDDTGEAYVGLGWTGHPNAAIKGYFGKDDEGLIANLHPGSVVTVAGICESGGFASFTEGEKLNMVFLHKCWVYGGQTSPPQNDSALEASTFARDYKRFSGQRVKVKGYIASFMDGPGMAVILGDKENSNHWARQEFSQVDNSRCVLCLFNGKDGAGDFHPVAGQAVTISGTCMGGYEDGHARLQECTVEKDTTTR